MRNKLILLLMVAAGFVACGHQTVYHHYEHMPSNGWEKNDTIKFSIGPVKLAGSYYEDVELRTDGDFPFQGLTLIIKETVYPKGETTEQALNCNLVDERGEISGSGVNYFQYRFPHRDLQLNEGDSVEISITHNMKREILPGVADLGIRLTKK